MLRSFAIWFLSLALLAAGYDGLTSTAATGTNTETQSLEDGLPPPPDHAQQQQQPQALEDGLPPPPR
jgi:hypothetical protein